MYDLLFSHKNGKFANLMKQSVFTKIYSKKKAHFYRSNYRYAIFSQELTLCQKLINSFYLQSITAISHATPGSAISQIQNQAKNGL